MNLLLLRKCDGRLYSSSPIQRMARAFLEGGDGEGTIGFPQASLCIVEGCQRVGKRDPESAGDRHCNRR